MAGLSAEHAWTRKLFPVSESGSYTSSGCGSCGSSCGGGAEPDVAAAAAKDRFGLGWRPELATGIFANLAKIDVLEVQADDYFHAPKSQVRSRSFGQVAWKSTSGCPSAQRHTLEGLCQNVELARRVTGSAPALENTATLIDPPGSAMTEPDWITAAVRSADTELLLDLHNILTNASNFGRDPYDSLARIPLDRVSLIHIAGGRPLPSGRILDDSA